MGEKNLPRGRNKSYNSSHDTVRVDTTSDNRSYPILLPVAKDNVWIIGGTYGSYGIGTQNVVDQTKGEPFSVDLLAEWSPRTPIDRNINPDACRMAGHTFLIPAMNAEGQCAPLLVDSMGFSLLPMEQPLPKEGPWGAIKYSGSFWTVPETQTAWLMGQDKQNHVFLAVFAKIVAFLWKLSPFLWKLSSKNVGIVIMPLRESPYFCTNSTMCITQRTLLVMNPCLKFCKILINK